MRRIRVGLVLLFGLALITASPAPAGAAAGSSLPLAGDWEGTGPHGAPLSFELVRQGGHLVASSLAVGYPASCPALARDAEAVPLSGVVYAGPGGAAGPGSSILAPVALSGRVPGSHPDQTIYVRGAFSSPHTGTLRVQIQKKVGCSWPDRTLTWRVHRAARRRVSDGTWTGPLSATGLINGNVRLVVSAQGRVVNYFHSFFTCLTDTQQGNTSFKTAPAYEFIHPDGSFLSPLNAAVLRGHSTTWSGRFSAAGTLTGTLSIFDDCTNRMIKAGFTARLTQP